MNDKSQVKSEPIEQLRDWCKNSNRRAPIDAIIGAIEAYDALQSQLTQAIARIHALEELGFEPKQYENLKAQLTLIQSANESQAEVIGKFEDAVGPGLCISEALDGIRKIKLQLTQAQSDNAKAERVARPHEG